MNKSTKKNINKLFDSVCDSVKTSEHHLLYIFQTNVKDGRDPLEKSQIEYSLDEAEMELMKELWEVSQNCLRIIKTIDKETLREFQEDSEVI